MFFHSLHYLFALNVLARVPWWDCQFMNHDSGAALSWVTEDPVEGATHAFAIFCAVEKILHGECWVLRLIRIANLCFLQSEMA
jgi:hypothetical protein